MTRAPIHRRSLSAWRTVWGRWFALIVLIFALPASEHLVRELALVVHAVIGCEAVAEDDCADGCDEGSGGGACLDGCGHCACCQPPMATSIAVFSVPVALSEREAAVQSWVVARPAGVRASPFRPPTA